MQTKTPEDPFQLLERSFDDYAHKRYQRDIAQGYNGAKATRLMPTSCSESGKSSNSEDDDRDDSTTNRMSALHHSLTSLNSTGRHTQGLPPTHPSQDSDSSQEPLLDSSMIPEKRRTPAYTSNTRATTPNSKHNPPTPEITPPQTQKRSRPPRPSLLSTQSLSQAESFVTARENQNSAASSRSTLQLLDLEYNVRRQHASKSDLHATNGISDNLSLTSSSTDTLTKSRSVTPKAQQRANGAERVRSSNEASTDAIDSEFHRNVTVKRYRPRKENQTTAKALPEQEVPKPSRKSLPKPCVVNEESPVALKKDESEDQGDWHNQVNNVLYTQLRDQKLKRLSGASGTSTLVEVIVLQAPPKPVQNLRHAGRNLALRDDFLTACGRSRVVSESAAAQQHRLRHRKSQIPERGSGDTVSTSFRAVSSPELSCRPSRDTVVSDVKELRPREKTGRDQSELFTAHVELPQPSLRHERRTHGDPANGNIMPNSLNAGERSGRARTYPGMRTGWNRTMEDQDLVSPERKPLRETPRKLINAESTFSDDPRPVRVHKHSGSASSIEYIPRGSLSAQRRRSSIDPNHLLPSSTPLSQQSQWSDRTDTLEVSEAKAVSIFPHNNHSLLVVQQRAGNILTADSNLQGLVADKACGHGLVLRDEPGYPTFRAIIESPTDSTNNLSQINSPLMSPRAAPDPPLINFIPATPNEEVDRQLIPVDAVPEAEPKAVTPLTRRQSLTKRARRYSEIIIGPLRTLSVGSRKRYTYVVRDDRPANLHPFWRPRGFWDDFDSEDDDDYYDDRAPTEPLPQGGDTSDVEDRETFPHRMSRRMSGFRGAGGFLLGNSLGFTRHGTNNRRHYIDQSTVRHSSASDSPGPASRELRRRRSERMLRTIMSSSDSLRRRRMADNGISKRPRVVWSTSFSGNVHVVSLRAFRKRLRQAREEKTEREREKRRQELKAKIGSIVSLRGSGGVASR